MVAEYRVSPDPDRSRRRERVLLTVPQPFANHNGGMIAFGRDGYLYIGIGDGGGGGDPGNRAQDPDDAARQDPAHRRRRRAGPVRHPGGQPVRRGRRAAGDLRARPAQPVALLVRPRDGRLWTGDVGQGHREEIDLIRRGGNYGWRILEGTRCHRPRGDCERSGLEPPLAEYRHQGDRCAVTGGYVYRGRALPELRGTYLFADFCSGEIFGLRQGRRSILLDSELTIASFGEDEAGELYVLDLAAGAVHRIAGTAP